MASAAIWRKQEVEVKNLTLWDENPRFPDEFFKKSEKDLIDYYLHDERRFELRKFANEVAQEFDLPQVERLTVLELKGKNIVLEGNRRIAVYKLLIQPDLAKETKDVEFFKNLQEKILIRPNFRLEANITDDKEQGLRLVDRKHKKGNNEVGWGELERRNDSVRRSKGTLQDIRRVNLGSLVAGLNFPKEITSKVLAKGYITTLYRILDSEPARLKLGYRVSSDGKISIKDERSFSDLLKVIVYNVYTKRKLGARKNNVDSRSLNSTESISKYLKSINRSDAKKVEKLIEANTAKVVLEKVKKTKKASSRVHPTCFVIMPLSGLDRVYRTVQSAWQEVFGKKAKAIHQLDDSNKGAKELLDHKILKNIRKSHAVVSIFSMGDHEKSVFEAIDQENRDKVFSRFFPLNLNVILETGYAISSLDNPQTTLSDFFLLADANDKEKINAFNYAKKHFFDVSHRNIIGYTEDKLEKLTSELVECFKEFKKQKGL